MNKLFIVLMMGIFTVALSSDANAVLKKRADASDTILKNQTSVTYIALSRPAVR